MSPDLSKLKGTSKIAGLCAVGLAASLALSACGSSGSGSGSTSTSGAPATTAPKAASLSTELSDLMKPPSGKLSLTEDGSSLLYPLYQAWVTGFAKVDTSFSSTSGADGSGTGISDAESGTTNFGASDAYLPPGTTSQYPTIENIPVAISAQMINYNVPGLSGTHLKLTGTIIADMYEGKITNWDDSAIKKLNPGANLPSLPVVPVHRTDSSGDSFLFTSFLADSDGSSFAAKQGPSTAPTFPSVTGGLGAVGNSGMVASCGATKGCIAYIGISYKSDTQKANLGEAMLQNKSGNYELPTASTIKAEAASYTNVPADGTLSLIYGPGTDGYPIINFEYIILKTNQPSSTTAQGIKAFLAWAMDPKDGSSPTYLNAVNFQPLPSGALSVALTLLKKVS